MSSETRSQVRFTKEQKQSAMRQGLPMTVICFEDRHLTKEQGGRIGQMLFIGPTSKAQAKLLLDFIPKFLKAHKPVTARKDGRDE